jgi:hypothetical protein
VWGTGVAQGIHGPSSLRHETIWMQERVCKALEKLVMPPLDCSLSPNSPTIRGAHFADVDTVETPFSILPLDQRSPSTATSLAPHSHLKIAASTTKEGRWLATSRSGCECPSATTRAHARQLLTPFGIIHSLSKRSFDCAAMTAEKPKIESRERPPSLSTEHAGRSHRSLVRGQLAHFLAASWACIIPA